MPSVMPWRWSWRRSTCWCTRGTPGLRWFPGGSSFPRRSSSSFCSPAGWAGPWSTATAWELSLMTKALAGKHLRVALACATALTLAACSEEPFDTASQVGPNPNLPLLQQYLFPPMHLAPVVDWKDGEKPIVADGLKIEALATGLQHPRSLYVLPNGDVLVVQSKQPWSNPIHRPKDLVMGWIESWVTSGGDTGLSNHITLLRDASGDGKPETQSVFLDHLTSTFGVALVGNDLYVANTDAIVRYPYTTGDTKIRHRADAASRRPHRPSLDQEPGREPGRLAPLCRRRLQQQHHRKRHGGGDGPRRHLGGRPGERPLAYLRERPAQPQRLELRAGKRRPVDRRQRARRTRPRPRARLYDLGEGRRLLRLALQLFR